MTARVTRERTGDLCSAGLPDPTVPGTVDLVLNDETNRVRARLVCLYGAVAAVVRGDTDGARILLSDLQDDDDDLTEVLVAISIATLERLRVAMAATSHLQQERDDLAANLIAQATAYRVSTARSVQGAALRLDAVRRGDHEGAASDVEHAAADSSPAELVLGATALLAAIVALWARLSGQSVRRAATNLCLAASFSPA